MELLLISVRNSFLIIGALFVLCGCIGVIRLPDFFSRVHAAGITETAGVGFIFAGLLIEAGLSLVSIKLLLILIFMLITSPTSSHALAKAAIHGKEKPLLSKLGK